MSQPLRVALQGFSTFERSTFEAFFRLSTRRSPAYQYIDSLTQCQLVIADGDHPATLPALTEAGKLGCTLWIGSREQAGTAQHVGRPINLMAVVKLLDQMPQVTEHAALATPTDAPALAEQKPTHQPDQPLTPTTPATPPAATVPPPTESQRVLLNLARSHSAVAAGSVSVAPALGRVAASAATERTSDPIAAAARADLPPPPLQRVAPSTTFAATDVLPIPDGNEEPARAVMDHILVVDDSDIALRFMANRLERFGFVVHLSRSGEDALARTEAQHFAFVFMDVNMPGLDGFKTCKAITRRCAAMSTTPPVVIMLTSRDTPVDKLRGTMAGCSGYLTKPLDENELFKIIGDREVQQHGFAETAQDRSNG